MITEGILNRGNQLVHRSDAPPRDSSRYDASPGETVDNLNRKSEPRPLENPLSKADAKDIPNPVSELLGTRLEDKPNPEEVKQAEQAIKEIVSEMNQNFDRSNLHLRFGTDEESGLDYYQLINRENGEVVRQFPPEELLHLAANMKEMTGVIFNEKV